MPLTAHLEELRWRVIKSLAALLVGFAASYQVADELFHWLTAPLLSLSIEAGGEHGVVLIGTSISEAFFTKLKVSLISGIFLASPLLLFQVWRFVAPGLYSHEKRYAIPFVLAGTLFFLAGALFSYLLVLPVGYRFFVEQYATIGVRPDIRIGEYLTFTSRLLLAFGVTFELPVVTFFLARVGLVTHRAMIHHLRYAILLIFIVAAVLTPGPDIASQLLMAGPLLFLYGISIGIAYAFAIRRSAPPESETARPQGD